MRSSGRLVRSSRKCGSFAKAYFWLLAGRLILTDWFKGTVYLFETFAYGYVQLKVNNNVIASTGTNGNVGILSSSISALHDLQAGDIVSIEYEAVGDVRLLG